MIRAALVSVGGLGYLRPAPGTWGSLPTAGLAGILLLLSVDPLLYDALLLLAALVFSVITVALGPWAEAEYGKKDPSRVVADETAGMALALLFIPRADATIPGAFWPSLIVVSIGFVLFRILDILKPQPAAMSQRLPAGWGVLVDDLIAGAYALGLLHLGLAILS